MTDKIGGAPVCLQSGLAADVVVGKDVKIIMPSNLYGCELKDGVFVGPFCEIQKGASIGRGTRIQSHCFICSKVRIGDDCFISHGVTFTNDRFRSGTPSFEAGDWEETVIEDGVCIGSNATILPVRIASGVVVGAGSVVTKDLLEPGIYAGSPARFLRTVD